MTNKIILLLVIFFFLICVSTEEGLSKRDGHDSEETVYACCTPDYCSTKIDTNTCENKEGWYLLDSNDCLYCSQIHDFQLDFFDELPIIEEAKSHKNPQYDEDEYFDEDDNDKNYYYIDLVEAKHRFHSDLPKTTLHTFDGKYPGSAIITDDKTQTIIKFKNKLPETNELLDINNCVSELGNMQRNVIHLHGGKSNPDSDGAPNDIFFPGQTKTVRYYNDQGQATLYYHDHAEGITRYNYYLGLTAPYIIHGSETEFKDRKDVHTGNYHDVTLMIADKTINRGTGELLYEQLPNTAFLGEHIVVNGIINPYMNVDDSTYRFRIINTCNSRYLTLDLYDVGNIISDNNINAFTIIGSDHGFLFDSAINPHSFTLSPAERAEIVIDFNKLYESGISNVYMRHTESDSSGSKRDNHVGNIEQDGNTFKFLRFDIDPDYEDSKNLLLDENAKYPSAPEYDVDDEDLIIVKMAMRGQLHGQCENYSFHALYNDAIDINHVTGNSVLHSIEEGSVRRWAFVNEDEHEHPLHIHLVKFRVIDRYKNLDSNDDMKIKMPISDFEKSGYKDVVNCPGGQTTIIESKFEASKKKKGFIVFHCHVLEHADYSMMGFFELRASKEEGCSVRDENDNIIYLSGAVNGNRICEAADGETCNNSNDCISFTNSLGEDICCGSNNQCQEGCPNCMNREQIPSCCGDGKCTSIELAGEYYCAEDCHQEFDDESSSIKIAFYYYYYLSFFFLLFIL